MRSSSSIRDQFIEAYDKHSDALFRFCYFRVSERELAKDLVQETFTKTWNYLAGGSEVDNLKSFLFKVAGNLVIDEYRKRKSVSLDALQENERFDTPNNDLDKIVLSAESEQIKQVIDKLESVYKEVVMMRYVDDLSPREIARILGETENVVSVRLNRAVRKMRDLMNT